MSSGDVFAGFTIERLLGQGGMGSVYLARHPRLPRLTALKLLNPELFADAEIRARFEREADLAAQLDHPNIVAVYDRGAEGDQLWMCMQYVDGVDAASVHPHTLPPERAVQIIEGVAAALDYAHSRGVLHRDVKPANIMLARSGAGKGERVFLTDFGIARLREDSVHLTQTGMFTATLAYASPEQMTGQPLDHRSDQYALGCALYWLLTATGPFDSPDPSEVIHGHLQLAVPPASHRRPGLSPALDPVIARAMAKRSADRYGSCTEFATAARHALTAPAPMLQPIGANPPPFGGSLVVPPPGLPGSGPVPPLGGGQVVQPGGGPVGSPNAAPIGSPGGGLVGPQGGGPVGSSDGGVVGPSSGGSAGLPVPGSAGFRGTGSAGPADVGSAGVPGATGLSGTESAGWAAPDAGPEVPVPQDDSSGSEDLTVRHAFPLAPPAARQGRHAASVPPPAPMMPPSAPMPSPAGAVPPLRPPDPGFPPPPMPYPPGLGFPPNPAVQQPDPQRASSALGWVLVALAVLLAVVCTAILVMLYEPGGSDHGHPAPPSHSLSHFF
ncbi:serine/threonine-protein kinase [Nocardia sp. alder85J]|uniref:serine/threonine-protein kinase n=1 Tax=Nocardia sp. alder85J TaxID=2862949 RepID=UPI002B1CB8ED|nr:serine/threonine-protein kinase [Nocardia sp. alder85J]